MKKMIFNRSPLEKNLDEKLEKYIKTTFRDKAWFLKISGSATQRKGVSDFIICIKGKMISIENKREDGSGKASKNQEIECRKIRKAGGIAIISDDFEEIKKLLQDVYNNN